MLYLFVYLFDRYDVVQFAIMILMFLCCVGFYFTLYHYNYVNKEMISKREWFEKSHLLDTEMYMSLENTLKTTKKYMKRFIITFLISGLVLVSLPSRNGFLALTGIYVGSQIYEKVDKSEIFDKSIKLLNLELNNKLDELIKSSTESKDKANDTNN